MKKKSLVLFMILALAVLAVLVSAGATLAYLTDRDNSDTVAYTVTPGAFLNISLDEPIWKAGNVAQPGFFRGNEAILSSERKVIKDPQVTSQAGSVDCYVRLIVKIDNALANVIKCPPDPYISPGQSASHWKAVYMGEANGVKEYQYYYMVPLKGGETTPRAFECVEFLSHTKNKMTMEQFFGPAQGKQIRVKAEAIQAEGFADYTIAPWNDAENLWRK